MKKFVEMIEMCTIVFFEEVLYQIIFPILWLIFIPFRIIVWIFNIEKFEKTAEEIEETLNYMKKYKSIHYTLSYLIIKAKINFGWIF